MGTPRHLHQFALHNMYVGMAASVSAASLLGKHAVVRQTVVFCQGYLGHCITACRHSAALCIPTYRKIVFYFNIFLQTYLLNFREFCFKKYIIL